MKHDNMPRHYDRYPETHLRGLCVCGGGGAFGGFEGSFVFSD